MPYLCKFVAVVAFALAVPCAAVDPDAIYDGGIQGNNGTIQLAIGNGGAGQSGLIKGNVTLYNLYNPELLSRPTSI
jgi:hypothetical protein